MTISSEYIGNQWNGLTVDPYGDPWYRFSRILAILNATTSVSVESKWLDLGCHQGQFASVIRAKYDCEVSGIDDWSGAVDADRGWQYWQRDLAHGIQLTQRFTHISALEVIEHMIDTDAFLRDCHEHLETNGCLVLSTPNINSLRNRITVPLGAYPAGLEYRNIIHHVRLYNPTTLIHQLHEHGFKIRAVRGVNFLPISLLRRRWAVLRLIEGLADQMPQLCGNFIVVASRE